jgi:hypothetical protein
MEGKIWKLINKNTYDQNSAAAPPVSAPGWQPAWAALWSDRCWATASEACLRRMAVGAGGEAGAVDPAWAWARVSAVATFRLVSLPLYPQIRIFEY